MNKYLNNKSKQSGAVLIELVIVLIFVIIPILVGVIEIGRLMYTYKVIVHQVHHAARFLSTQAPGSGHEKSICLFKTGYLVANCTSLKQILDGFNESICTVEDASNNTADHKQVGGSGQSTYINLVTFKVEDYNYKFIFSNFFGGATLTFKPISATYRQVG